MEKPQARIIDQQHVESEKEITGWEAEQLLRKYGHQPQQFSSIPEKTIDPIQEMTFEELMALQDKKEKEENLRILQKQKGPNPITFNGERGYDSEIRYSQDDDTGFGFKIEISTDMKIPRY